MPLPDVKSKRPMKVYVADYIGDTMHLSTEQHGALLLLLMHHHYNDSLPTEDSRLARVARLSVARWKRMRTTVMELVKAFTEARS